MTIPCALCNKPMEVPKGTLMFTHRACRKQARRAGLKEAIRASEKRLAVERTLEAVGAVIHTARPSIFVV